MNEEFKVGDLVQQNAIGITSTGEVDLCFTGNFQPEIFRIAEILSESRVRLTLISVREGGNFIDWQNYLDAKTITAGFLTLSFPELRFYRESLLQEPKDISRIGIIDFD